MIVYLARHGETFANRGKVVLGRGDSPLTPSGIESAEKLAARLSGRQIRWVLSSPLGHASASARLMADRLGAEVIHHDGLMELSCGEWEGKTRGLILPSEGYLRSSWNDAPPGGESCQMAETRVAEAIDWIRTRPNLGPLLVVGHSMVNRVFLKIRLGLSPALAMSIRHPFDLIYVLRENDAPLWFDASGMTGAGLITDSSPL
ncbi:MAG: histidine phosphatase family protein [Syntrophobacter sp.]